MPTQTVESKQDFIDHLKTLKIAKKNEKFADFATVLSFPKEYITSKMAPLTSHDESFLINSLRSDPLLVVKNQSVIVPAYEKNDLIPLKPIQRLSSFAESSGLMVLSHGGHSLDFAKIEESFNNEYPSFKITRFCQKNVANSYKKLLFANGNDFYGKNDSEICLYDFNRTTRIEGITSKSNIFDFDYCPLQSSIVAYTNGSLNVTDIRASSECSSYLYKQRNLSTLVRWNPSVPYWLATANSESLNIFDIRYNSALPVLSIQHANIQDLCWSPSNSDLILASSKDRRTNLWSLSYSQDDCRLSMTKNRFELGCILPSRHHNHVFYGLDGSDSLTKIKIRPEYLTSIAPSNTTVDLEYKQIEDSLYSADFESFASKLSQIAEKAFENSNYTKLKQLVLLTMPPSRASKSMRFDEKIVASIRMKGDFDEFKQLLASSTSTSFKEPFTPEESSKIQKFIDQLRLKIRVVELLASGDFESLAKFMDLVTEAFCQDLNFLDKSQSIKFLAFILKNDRNSAFEFLIRIIKAHLFGTPEIIQIWVWMACYPTIFDSKSFELIKIRPSLSKSLADLETEANDFDAEDDFKIEKYLEKLRRQFYDSLLLNPQIGPQNVKIINQLYLNLGSNPMNLSLLLSTERNCGAALKEVQKALLDGSTGFFIISAEMIKILLEKSLRSSSKSFLVDFFMTAFRLQVLTEKTPIYSGIQEFVTTVGFARLRFLLTSVNSNIPAAVNSIITIGTDQYSNLSEDQLNYLGEQLAILSEKIDDFSSINNDFVIDNDLQSVKFKTELQKILKETSQ